MFRLVIRFPCRCSTLLHGRTTLKSRITFHTVITHYTYAHCEVCRSRCRARRRTARVQAGGSVAQWCKPSVAQRQSPQAQRFSPAAMTCGHCAGAQAIPWITPWRAVKDPSLMGSTTEVHPGSTDVALQKSGTLPKQRLASQTYDPRQGQWGSTQLNLWAHATPSLRILGIDLSLKCISGVVSGKLHARHAAAQRATRATPLIAQRLCNHVRSICPFIEE